MKLFGLEIVRSKTEETSVEAGMSKNIELAKQDRENLSKLPCPQCCKTTLRSLTVERGGKGWETRFFCDSCKTGGVLNQTGFHVEYAYSEKDKK